MTTPTESTPTQSTTTTPARRLSVVDHLRIENAVQRYEAWLEMRGVRGRRRRELRRELRTNLREAAADVGVTEALFGIGSAKELAYAVSEPDPRRPRWTLGMIWATLAFCATFLVMFFTSIAVMDTVLATGITGKEVAVEVFPWFGTTYLAQARPDHGGLSFGISAPWALLVLPLVVFVLVAQPWRPLLRGRRSEGAAELVGP